MLLYLPEIRAQSGGAYPNHIVVIYLDRREHSRQLDPKWWASLYGLLLFLFRYGVLDLDWSIWTLDLRHASLNRSLNHIHWDKTFLGYVRQFNLSS